MAEILPMSTDLSEDMEGSSIDVTFTAQLSTGETLVSINIIDYEATPGVNVENNHLYGTYESVFSFGSDSLKYRIGDEIKGAESWETLPPPEDADLFLWKAPGNLRKQFDYTVELIYNYQPPDESGGEGGSSTTPPVIEKRLVKVYTKIIVGNWSKWANKLRSYVYVRG